MSDADDPFRPPHPPEQVAPTHNVSQAAGVDLELQGQVEPVARTQWQLFLRRFLRHKMAVLSVVYLAAIMTWPAVAAWPSA